MFFQQLVNGLSLGALYALIAVGFALLFSILDIINFAHGSLFMVAAYVAALLLVNTRVPFVLAILIAILSSGLLGILVERMTVNPLRQRNLPMWFTLITTFAAALIIENLGYRIFGTDYGSFPSPFSSHTFLIFGAKITNFQVFTAIAALILMVLVAVFVRYTWIGRAFRAVAQDAPTASLMGVNVSLIVAMAFFLSGGLGGAAGVLAGIYYNLVAVNMGIMAGLKGFVASVMGGMGSIAGAALGGFVLGLAEVLASAYISSDAKDIVAFLLLMAILFLRPSGLLGRRVA